MEKQEMHVVMLPFSAMGHLIPYFQLSLALAKAGVRVSFIATPRNIQRLPKVPPHLSPLIRLVPIPLPKHPLLPDGAEATVDLPFHLSQYLKAAYDQLRRPVQDYVARASPDWLVADFCAHWAVDISEELRVPLMPFFVFCATFVAFSGPPEYLEGEERVRVRPDPESMTRTPHWIHSPCPVACRPYEAVMMHPAFYFPNESGISDSSRIAKILKACHAVAIRSCHEFEGEYLDLCQKLFGKPVIPTGMLPPEKVVNTKNIYGSSTWSECFKWLDRQEPKRVVFVAFGTEAKLSRNDVAEIAHGLEKSGVPFVWVLQDPAGEGALPPGFAERVSERGKVCFGWSPQMEVLGHASVGGCLNQAGLGSVTESLQFGHTLVVLPFVVDQGPNARLLVDKGLAVEVERREDGLFTREGVAEALTVAMVSEKGEKLRAACREAAGYFGDQDHYVGKLVEFLRKGGRK